MAKSIVDTDRPRLTPRERFRRQMHYQSIDRGVHWEFGYLQETAERWHREGLSEEIAAGPAEGSGSIEAYFGVEPIFMVPISHGPIPEFSAEYEVIEKREHSEIQKFADGTILEQKTDGVRTIPHYIKFPIANRDDWKRFKEHFNPDDPERYRTDWKKVGRAVRDMDVPVGINLGSYLGTPRNWIGFENIALMCYDDRDLLEEIIETLTQVYYNTLAQALEEVEVDFAAGWEDICFKNGPIISPQMFSEIVIPRLKRVTTLLRQHGCDVIWTDCDGNITKLVPLWLEAGLNCMFPLEVQAGSDPVELRKEYGREILLRGGLRKYEFAKGRKEILAELKRVEKVFEEGGYIPHGDHRIPEDVPYENYKYYVREKCAMMGWKKEDIQAIWPLRDLK